MRRYVHGWSDPSAYVRAQLIWLLDFAREYDVHFSDCLAEARWCHQKEVRERTDRKPLPERSK